MYLQSVCLLKASLTHEYARTTVQSELDSRTSRITTDVRSTVPGRGMVRCTMNKQLVSLYELSIHIEISYQLTLRFAMVATTANEMEANRLFLE